MRLFEALETTKKVNIDGVEAVIKKHSVGFSRAFRLQEQSLLIYNDQGQFVGTNTNDEKWQELCVSYVLNGLVSWDWEDFADITERNVSIVAEKLPHWFLALYNEILAFNADFSIKKKD